MSIYCMFWRKRKKKKDKCCAAFNIIDCNQDWANRCCSSVWMNISFQPMDGVWLVVQQNAHSTQFIPNTVSVVCLLVDDCSDCRIHRPKTYIYIHTDIVRERERERVLTGICSGMSVSCPGHRADGHDDTQTHTQSNRREWILYLCLLFDSFIVGFFISSIYSRVQKHSWNNQELHRIKLFRRKKNINFFLVATGMGWAFFFCVCL